MHFHIRDLRVMLLQIGQMLLPLSYWEIYGKLDNQFHSDTPYPSYILSKCMENSKENMHFHIRDPRVTLLQIGQMLLPLSYWEIYGKLDNQFHSDTFGP